MSDVSEWLAAELRALAETRQRRITTRRRLYAWHQQRRAAGLAKRHARKRALARDRLADQVEQALRGTHTRTPGT